MKALGTHIVCELSGCNAALLTDVDAVAEMMEQAAREANATPIEKAFHRFQPQGVSGVVVIQESHLSIHTWPEESLIAIDLFSCGAIDGERVLAELTAALRLENPRVTTVERGIPAGAA